MADDKTKTGNPDRSRVAGCEARLAISRESTVSPRNRRANSSRGSAMTAPPLTQRPTI
jgi:hypothetical protein